MSENTPSFLEAFAIACRDYPGELAVADDESTLTYRQLDQLANRIGNYLVSQGPISLDQPDEYESVADQTATERCIGLCLDRSSLAIASMIGIMRAGYAFVPLDPEYPTDRLVYMIQDAGISQIICDERYRDLFQSNQSNDSQSKIQLIDPQSQQLTESSNEPISVDVNDSSLAYVMYTSGSTGMPKGVQIEHRALATYCWADVEIYKLQQSDRTLQFSTLNFDIAIEEIFPPLMIGSAVIVRPQQRSDSENELSSLVRKHDITALHLATAYWHEWVDLIAASHDTVPESLRMVLATGEKVSPAHYLRWLELCDKNILWCNAYGPTEATVTATVFTPDHQWSGENMPIGKPLPGYTAHILDPDDHPLGIGETGDLYIGGPALARGYLNLPEKTESVFRNIEIEAVDGKSETKRLYKTGDLARWLPSGDIEFAGRIDHQIKLGSYRIEPGEIEYHITSHPSVLETLVSHDEVDGKKMLVAYVATGNSEVSATEIVGFLRDRMPPYMVPSRYCFLSSFPKTINGKIDRQQLPDPKHGQFARSAEFGEPRNDMERMLVELWSEILGVSSIGIHDDFFVVGGSSLLVTRVIAGIRKKYNLAIPVRDFFANPTIASITRLLAKRLNQSTAANENDGATAELRSQLPQIDPFYFECGPHQLFGVHYPPLKPTGVRRGVLFCNADGHEYARSHRNLQQLATQLAKAGFHVLRFDYSGCGNSSGDNRDGRIENWLQEISVAAEVFRERCDLDNLTLFGVRLGATLAANAHVPFAQSRILWDPISNGKDYLHFLDGLHHSSLYGVSNYLFRRQTDIPQTFGVELPLDKRQQYERLTFDLSECNEQDVTVLLSQQYQNSLLMLRETAALEIVQTDDEIFWDDRRHTQSAFSTPRTLRALIDVLATDRPTANETKNYEVIS